MIRTPSLGVGGDDLTHAYVGRCRCGHAYFVGVDDATPSLALDVADIIRDGGTIERVTIEQARTTPLSRCTKCLDIRRNR